VSKQRKPPVAFGEVKQGVIATPNRTISFDVQNSGRGGRSFKTSDTPPVVRYSTALKRMRAEGADTSEFERDKTIGAVCPNHGIIEDPIIGILSDRVAFACPWCSGATLFKTWEDEGKREKRS